MSCTGFEKRKRLRVFWEWGMIVLIVFFPFYFLFSHPTVLASVLCAVLLGIWMLWRCGGATTRFHLSDGCAVAFASLLLLYGVIGRGRVIDGAVAAVFVLTYLPARELFLQDVWRKRLQKGVGIACLLCSAYGVLQYAFGGLTPKWVDLRLFSDIGGRVTSFFENPNVLAIYLLFCFPLTLCQALDPLASRAWQCLFGASFALCAVCLLLTWTRGAWLGALLQGLLVLTLYGRRTRTFLPWLCLCGVLSVPLLPSPVVRRLGSIVTMADSSVLYRFHTWKGVLRMILSHPFGVGVGEQAFRAVYPRYAVMGTETVMHAHNLLLQVTVESGVVGVAIFLAWVVLSLLRASWRGSTCAYPVALCGLLVMGMFDHLWYAPAMFLLFTVAVALSATSSGKRDSLRPKNVSILHENLQKML